MAYKKTEPGASDAVQCGWTSHQKSILIVQNAWKLTLKIQFYVYLYLNFSPGHLSPRIHAETLRLLICSFTILAKNSAKPTAAPCSSAITHSACGLPPNRL